MENNFHFHIPVNLVKSKKNSNEMIVDGIASTSHWDREGDSLVPAGFDYSFLLNNGYINYNHLTNESPEAATIGEPIDVQVTKKGLYIKGKLYPSNTKAVEVYKAIKSVGKDSKTRRWGWSIEGKVLQRHPVNKKKILRARITGVALTPMPINPNTFVNILKSFSQDKELTPNGGNISLIDTPIENGHISLKDNKLVVDLGKSFTTAEGAGLMPESLEGAPKESEPKDVAIPFDSQQAFIEILKKYPNIEFEKAMEMYETLKGQYIEKK